MILSVFAKMMVFSKGLLKMLSYMLAKASAVKVRAKFHNSLQASSPIVSSPFPDSARRGKYTSFCISTTISALHAGVSDRRDRERQPCIPQSDEKWR